MREKLPNTREGITLHFAIIAKKEEEVVEVDGYVTTGEYPDGRLGELFIRVSKELAALGPMMDAWATQFSISLQQGSELELLCSKEIGTRFEPSGAVKGVAGIARCTSPTDLICRWLLKKYKPEAYATLVGEHS